MVSPQTKTGLLMGFGAFGVLCGAVMLVYWPPLFFGQLMNRMILTNVSYSYDIWRETPLPMYLECFMWNISNVDGILAGTDQRLQFQQMGPYVFRESHTKTNITFNTNNTVTFYNQRYWHFEPEMSNGSLSDAVTSINPIIVTVAYFMRHERLVLRPLVDVFLRYHHSSIFLTANVTSWMFDGIEDPVLDISADLPFINIPYDKFGWFYDRNGSMTFDGSFVMNTGAEDFSRLGNIELWRGSNRTLYRDECGEVRGSTGELWAPELGQPNITIFASDVCTYMTLAKSGPIEVEGIEGVLYAADDALFDNGYRYPEMACYCDEIRNDDCLPPGALNVSSCRLGAPAFVSLPHFYNADPYYPDKIDGMNPGPEHNFGLALEMFTGIPLQVAAQLQINLLVRHMAGITINNQLPDADTLVPMFWFRQEVRITPEYAALARQALNIRYGVPYALYAVTAIGLALLLAGITILIRNLLRSPDTRPILAASQESLSQ